MINPERLKKLGSETAILLAAFGLGAVAGRQKIIQELPMDFEILRPSIVAITGPSGSGKSTILKMLASLTPDFVVAEAPLISAEAPIIEAWPITSIQAMKMLTHIGLSDPFTWLRTYGELSEGQKARHTLGGLFAGSKSLVVVDEFLNTLDRPTAKAVAFTAQKCARKNDITLVVATSQDDIVKDLAPDVWIRCDWSGTPEIVRPCCPKPDEVAVIEARGQECSLLAECVYELGTRKDWIALKELHYAAGEPIAPHSFHVLRHPEVRGPVAVCVLTYPDLNSAARNLATDGTYRINTEAGNTQRLNREVLRLARLVVTPELRSCGLAHRLVSEIIKRVDVKYIECSTALGRFTGLFESLGFREIPQGAGPAESALLDWALRTKVPALTAIDPGFLISHVAGLTVRGEREARQIIWTYYHQFVLHRRTRKAPDTRVPNKADERWQDAFLFTATRLTERPVYYIIGPIEREKKTEGSAEKVSV
jgi:NitT/TauT family transport system ATP-binding protein